MKLLNFKSISGISLVLAATAFAQDSSPQHDVHLLAQLHQGNLNEIEAGRLAVRHGQMDSVRIFGDQLIRDHSKADSQVMALANSKHWDLVSALKPVDDQERKGLQKDKATLAELKDLEGSEFDDKFKQAMVKDHEKDIQMFSDAIPTIRDADEKQLIQNLLPTLRHHEEMAMKLPGAQPVS